ncbi:unnamed protein product [Amaranthus hypochondriacus]
MGKFRWYNKVRCDCLSLVLLQGSLLQLLQLTLFIVVIAIRLSLFLSSHVCSPFSESVSRLRLHLARSATRNASSFSFYESYLVSKVNVAHEYKEWKDEDAQLVTCSNNIVQSGTPPLEVDADKEVFTYDVTFEASDIKWASRWDTYLLINADQIHWFFIINSNDCAFPLWPPLNSNLLFVYVDTGVQVFGMTLVTMMFALPGFLLTSNCGVLMTAMVMLWVFMGLFGGYSSIDLYKMFKGTEWKNTLKIAFMFPGILFSVFFVLNTVILGEKSSGAIPFRTMMALSH